MQKNSPTIKRHRRYLLDYVTVPRKVSHPELVGSRVDRTKEDVGPEKGQQGRAL